MRRFLAVGLAAVLLLSLSGTAFAAKGGNKGGNGGAGVGSPAAACQVDPNVATLGGQYTVTASNLPASLFVNVDVSDSVGTSVYMGVTDASGNLAMMGWAAWSGASTVAVVAPTNNKPQVLATCSFQVN